MQAQELQARVHAKLSTLNAAIDRERASIRKLELELADIDAAERLIARWESDKITVDPPRESKTRMPIMIREVLEYAHSLGISGLRPIDIAAHIRARRWAGADTKSVGPIVWRMWTRGDLVREGVLYSLPPGDR